MKVASTNRRQFLKTSSSALAVAGLVAATETAPASQGGGSIRKGIVISMLPKEMSYLDRFKLAAAVGFQGIEAQTVKEPETVAEIKEASQATRIPIHSVMNMDHWKYPFSSADPAVAAASLKGMETSLRNAREWGASAVLLVPAVVNAETSYKDAYTRSQKRIRELVPLAKELGVVIAIENVWNKFLLSPLEFARYLDELGSPWVKAYFDVGNIVLFGFAQDWIRALGERIVKVHLKDFNSETRQFAPLREGSVDWPEVRAALQDIGFKGFATVELKGGDETYLKDVSGRVDQILNPA
jgi:L-ribulose-5-phosphate 3-epimerase